MGTPAEFEFDVFQKFVWNLGLTKGNFKLLVRLYHWQPVNERVYDTILDCGAGLSDVGHEKNSDALGHIASEACALGRHYKFGSLPNDKHTVVFCLEVRDENGNIKGTMVAIIRSFDGSQRKWLLLRIRKNRVKLWKLWEDQ